MAPVGSYESLAAAIQAGADSIYFGIGKLNMRSKSANNFDINDLSNIISICKKSNTNSYLTLNTIIYDNELDEMKKIIDLAAEQGVSAIIASDISVMQYANQKSIPVHASTQVNITNIEAIKFYAQFCDTIVLARELNLTQVKEITDKIKLYKIKGPTGNLIKIEMFCHGALCMAVSGKCYLSLNQYNYSANRGQCLQACRRAYIVKDAETGDELAIDNEYIMSPKDLCTITFLNKIIDAGVSVLKIEGRARSAEYVKTTVECYDEAIKAYINDNYDILSINKWQERLSTVFNRGFWNGYYLGQPLGEWSNVYGSAATKTKVYIGKITNFFNNINVAEVKLETKEVLKIDDEILIIGETTGVIQQTVTEIRKNDLIVKEVSQGDIFSILLDTLARRGDKIYIFQSTK